MTLLVTSPVVLSPYVAVAEYCWVTPGATVVFKGAIARDVMEVEPGKNCPQPTAASRSRETEATTGKILGRCTVIIVPPVAEARTG